MAQIDAFFKLMNEQGASDLHMIAGQQPLLRMSGVDLEKLTQIRAPLVVRAGQTRSSNDYRVFGPALSLQKGLPISFGIITADTLEQAIERAGSKQGNKGRDASLSAIEMATLYKNL